MSEAKTKNLVLGICIGNNENAIVRPAAAKNSHPFSIGLRARSAIEAITAAVPAATTNAQSLDAILG
jgi:hypothetical protein